MKKHYKNNDITIHWDSSKCSHSGVCIRTLPKVYNINEKPWVKIENATTNELKQQIEQCPSGALTYTYNMEKGSK